MPTISSSNQTGAPRGVSDSDLRAGSSYRLESNDRKSQKSAAKGTLEAQEKVSKAERKAKGSKGIEKYKPETEKA